MPQPLFIFTRHANSFSVRVDNLEKLDISQIREIERFIHERKGVFDFQTYTFVIQKRIEFEEFCMLLNHLGIEATCQENFAKPHPLSTKIEFGKYKGAQLCELPDEYLEWLKRNYRGGQREVIEEEYRRRNL